MPSNLQDSVSSVTIAVDKRPPSSAVSHVFQSRLGASACNLAAEPSTHHIIYLSSALLSKGIQQRNTRFMKVTRSCDVSFLNHIGVG